MISIAIVFERAYPLSIKLEKNLLVNGKNNKPRMNIKKYQENVGINQSITIDYIGFLL